VHGLVAVSIYPPPIAAQSNGLSAPQSVEQYGAPATHPVAWLQVYSVFFFVTVLHSVGLVAEDLPHAQLVVSHVLA